MFVSLLWFPTIKNISQDQDQEYGKIKSFNKFVYIINKVNRSKKRSLFLLNYHSRARITFLDQTGIIFQSTKNQTNYSYKLNCKECLSMFEYDQTFFGQVLQMKKTASTRSSYFFLSSLYSKLLEKLFLYPFICFLVCDFVGFLKKEKLSAHKRIHGREVRHAIKTIMSTKNKITVVVAARLLLS